MHEKSMKAAVKIKSFYKIAGVVRAVRYRRAAKRDERNGFPLTAAFEWRKAAELSAPIVFLEKNCWREWERIMHVPHRLAAPIDVAPALQAGTLQSNLLRTLLVKFPLPQNRRSRLLVCEFPGINIQQLLTRAEL
jgi:hypothetical protein